jgi:hypothetical protein
MKRGEDMERLQVGDRRRTRDGWKRRGRRKG